MIWKNRELFNAIYVLKGCRTLLKGNYVLNLEVDI